MVCTPRRSELVLNTATLPVVRGTNAITVPLSRNVTLPVGIAPVAATVAVKATFFPRVPGFGAPLNFRVTVGTLLTTTLSISEVDGA
jgi:hypothetical protein